MRTAGPVTEPSTLALRAVPAPRPVRSRRGPASRSRVLLDVFAFLVLYPACGLALLGFVVLHLSGS